MLPAAARLTHRDDFAAVIRRGRRAGRTLVVMHALLPDTALTGSAVTASDHSCTPVPEAGVTAAAATGTETATDTATEPRVGFVVSKAVGGSVVRHRVARRLRHVMRDRLPQLPRGSRVVVRALPKAADADSSQLAADVDRALRALLAGTGRR